MFEKAGLTTASKATIVAHPMGYLVTSLFAIKYPEKVAKSVLLSPAP